MRLEAGWRNMILRGGKGKNYFSVAFGTLFLLHMRSESEELKMQCFGQGAGAASSLDG